MRVLIITNLFPNNVDPSYAPFNRLQFRALKTHADVEVLATLPWRFGRWSGKGQSADVVHSETIDALPVRHPRFAAIPGLSALNAGWVTLSVVPELLKDRLRGRRYDVILGSYAYPDGCAAVLLGRALGLPVVVKCHGSDLNRVPQDLAARLQLQALLPRAASVVVVSKTLGARAVELGVPQHKLKVVYNGVDRARFYPRDRAECRRALGLSAAQKVVLYVGHLADHKGAGDLLAAAERVHEGQQDVVFAFAGAGPLKSSIEQSRAARALGHLSHEEVARWLGAADLLCLPSWGEGMPNVVREAHASGRPVVGTRVGGIPEAIHREELGRLVEPKQPEALAEALRAQLTGPQVPGEKIAEYAVVPTWEQSGAALMDALSEARAP